MNIHLTPFKNLYFIPLLLSKVALDISYFFHITDIFAYLGFINKFSMQYFIVSLFVLFLFSFLINFRNKFISDYFLIFIIHLIFLPSLTLITFQAISFSFFTKWTLLFLILILFFQLKIDFKNKILYPINYDKNKFLIAGFLCFIPYYLIFGFNFNFSSFNILSPELYEGRDSFSQQFRSQGLLKYFFSNFQNVILPLLLALSLLKRNIILITLSLFFYIYIFFTTTFKSIFIAPFAIFFSYYLISKKFLYLPKFIIYNFSIIILVFFILDFFLPIPILNSLLIRRLFFLPVLISEQYFTFFETNGFTYFSELPVLNNLSLFSIDYSIPTTIGKYFYGSGYVNVNFLADSYIKLGFLSSIIYVFALKLLISFADHNFDIKNQFLIFSIIFVPFFSLANSALTTSLFSHGLLLSLILVSQSSFNETRKKT